MQSISETCKMWGVSRSRVVLWIAEGVIKSVKLGPRATMVLDAKPPPKARRGRPPKSASE